MGFTAINTLWVLLGAILVFFMQAGFAIFEAGLTRAKNAGNIVMKNLMGFCVGAIAFWLLGFGIMFGRGSSVFGAIDLFAQGPYTDILPEGVPFSAYFVFQTVFCAIVAAIVTGAMAERTKFSAFCICSFIIALIVYPVAGHWIWGGGWLSTLGFHDFAGGAVVHTCGGCAALAGAKILGPRIGKYDKHGRSRVIPGQNLVFAALGVFVLWFCWFGFTGCSTLGLSSDVLVQTASDIFMKTTLSAALAGCTTMLFTWIRYGQPDVSMTLNGVLSGLAAVTAGCDAVTLVGAAIMGIVAGIIVVLAIEFIDKKCKIDDPVGAVGVHLVCGAIGTVMIGFFSNSDTVGKGLFYGGGVKLLLIQILGVVAVIAWVGVIMTIVFCVIKKTIGLRVPEKEEVEGLDIGEHGLMSPYGGILLQNEGTRRDLAKQEESGTASGNVPVERAVPVEFRKQENRPKDSKLTKISIITKQSKFEALKDAMNDIGVTGMTVTQVLGCGMQKGISEYYRGVPLEMQLLPKIKVEIVVAKVPVGQVIDTAKKVLYTGHIGDGKIFISDISNAVKVRTGEEGYDAMQGVDDV